MPNPSLAATHHADALPRRQRRGLVACYVGVFLFSLWMRSGFPVYAISNAGHDDLLFVQLAGQLASGNWLGPYNNLTLAKGPAYPAFIAAMSLIGIPLKTGEHILYMLASLLASLTVARISKKAFLGLILFAVLAFNPVLWTDQLARVIREGLYISLSLMVPILALRLAIIPHATRNGLLSQSIAFGACLAAFWLTREEGVWILPTLGFLVLSLFACHFWPRRQGQPLVSARTFAAKTAIGCFCALAFVGAGQTANFVKYGVFTTVEFKAPGFLHAYGAISRIEHDQRRRLVVFPKDAREKGYAVSARLRELQPYFEGEMGEGWRAAGCNQMAMTDCPEILAGWFMWALRDATARAGHYGYGRRSEEFYEALAGEIDNACAAGELRCLPPRQTVRPPLQTADVVDALRTVPAMVLKLLTFDGARSIGSLPSSGPEDLRNYFRLNVGPISLANEDPLVNMRGVYDVKKAGIQFLAKGIGAVYTFAGPVFFLAGVLGTFLTLALGGWRMPRVLLLSALALASLAAVVTRVFLLSYLDVTSIPSLNILYLSPATPFAVIVMVIGTWLGVSTLFRKKAWSLLNQDQAGRDEVEGHAA